MARKKKITPSPPHWLAHAWWIVPVLALVVYIPSLTGDFTLDDIPIIEDNTLIRSADNLGTLWTTHYWAGKIDATDTGLYRPLTLTTYALQYIIHGKEPLPFHLLNILLHALTCFVLMRFVNLLFRDLRLAALAGLIFAVHPIHTEAVAGIVGRAEIMAALFILLAGIQYHFWRQNGRWPFLAGLIASTAAAIFSKEHGFMIFLLLGLQELKYYLAAKKPAKIPARSWIAIGGVLVTSAILWVIRSSITGPAKPHEQWLAVDPIDRMATSVRTTMEYILLHFNPSTLAADYWSDQVPVTGWGNWQVILAFLLCGGLLGLAFYQTKMLKDMLIF